MRMFLYVLAGTVLCAAALALLLLASLAGALPIAPRWVGLALAINMAVLVLLLFLALRVLRRWVSDVTCGLAEDELTQPPAELHLVPVDELDWCDDETAGKHEKDLRHAGYQPLGGFEAEEVDGLLLSAWSSPSQPGWALIYEHPQAGVFVDFCAPLEDDGTITVTNAAMGDELDERPGHPKRYLKGKGIRELHACFVEECAQRRVRAMPASEFQSYFERVYRESMAWRAQRGTTEEEIRRVAANMEEEVSEDVIQRTAQKYKERQA